MQSFIHLTDATRVRIVKIEVEGRMSHWINIEDGEGGEISIFGTPEKFEEIGRKINETLSQWGGEKIQAEVKPQGISQIPPDNIRKVVEGV